MHPFSQLWRLPLNQLPPSACPVDPAARAAWLEASSNSNSNSNPQPTLPPNHPPTTTPTPPPRLLTHRPLASDRTISSIPRAASSPSTTTPNPSSPPSPNAQTPTPLTSATGNWIYPSERMFFDALSRKAHSPRAEDMALVVPIHNAVNERAWAEIKGWELGRRGNGRCGGPRLRSFRGESGRLTPRARWYALLGYERPFDRHDWVVERCAEGEGGRERRWSM
ncbi:hypothetical protein G7Y79_00024g055760 [Physcia stellaris]|nr:hypothetical protein G7Y79_00024g055760 [Physcia stellaris]